MRITWLTDMDRSSSGYGNLSVPLMTGLVKRGHRIICLGSGYRGEEHDHPFAVIPVAELGEANGMIRNLIQLKEQDALVVALDINVQESFLRQPWKRETRYVGVFPVESDPISMSWAAVLHLMDARLVLSRFGLGEMQKAGVSGAVIPIALDTKAWRPAGADERSQVRKLMGIRDDEFVILCVSENQERKHLSRTLEVFKAFRERPDVPPCKLWMVTRSKTSFGWRLEDLALEYGLSDSFALLEKGMPQKQVWTLFAAADCTILTSKCEGLGMVLLESMACGVPVVATDCSAVSELLEDGRGFGIKWDATLRDPFLNCRRYLASIDSGVEQLLRVYRMTPDEKLALSHKTVDYVKSRTPEHALDVLEAALAG
jgi:glycosyltransferase involved in cell wall biosynthesis